jgi:hypothetical protein
LPGDGLLGGVGFGGGGGGFGGRVVGGGLYPRRVNGSGSGVLVGVLLSGFIFHSVLEVVEVVVEAVGF